MVHICCRLLLAPSNLLKKKKALLYMNMPGREIFEIQLQDQGYGTGMNQQVLIILLMNNDKKPTIYQYNLLLLITKVFGKFNAIFCNFDFFFFYWSQYMIYFPPSLPFFFFSLSFSFLSGASCYSVPLLKIYYHRLKNFGIPFLRLQCLSIVHWKEQW